MIITICSAYAICKPMLQYRLMQTKQTFHLLIIVALLLFVPAAAAQGEVGDLLGRINNLRASLGRGGYTLNGALSAAAQSQAQWIVDNGSVSHTRPDGSGPRTRALNAGYPSTQVSENIYGGTNASVNDAWTFWVNSGIHYASLVNPAYTEVGVGIARGGWGAAFVLVFGNPGGAPPPAPASAGSASNSGGGGGRGNQAASGPPSYVLGLDDNGNIMHQVQPGDTLGDIALIYGYTWADLPALMSLNNLSDVRDLDVGSIFLVPRREGTYTPTPDPNSPTPSPTPSQPPPTITPFVAVRAEEAQLIQSDSGPLPIITPVIATPTIPIIATAEGLPDFLATGTLVVVAFSGDQTGTPVAALPTLVQQNVGDPVGGILPNRDSNSTWILIALGLQVVLVIGAGIEFVRRARRR